MRTVVLDSHALLTFFERQPGWPDVVNLLEEGAAEATRLLLSVVNWGEIAYITQRTYGAPKRAELLQAIDTLPVEIIPADRAITAVAARLKARGGLSYADCFAAGLALAAGGIVATGDPEFEAVTPEVEVLWIPSDLSETS